MHGVSVELGVAANKTPHLMRINLTVVNWHLREKRTQMVYKYPHQAFLFEAIIGFVSVALLLTIGRLGLLALCLVALRPFVLKTSSIKPDQRMYRLYYDAMRVSVFFAGAAIALTILVIGFGPFTPYDKALVVSLIISWFMLAHGFIGYNLSRPKGPFTPSAG